MRNPLVPSDFRVPQKAVIGNYRLEPLTATINDEDHRVIIANADAITRQRGGSRKDDEVYANWPYSFSLEDNYKDLAWLETCANWRMLFSYVMRHKVTGEYTGSVYLYPIEIIFPDLAARYDVDLSLWITQSEYDAGLYDQVFREILDWVVRGWPFDPARIHLGNAEIPDDLRQA